MITSFRIYNGQIQKGLNSIREQLANISSDFSQPFAGRTYPIQPCPNCPKCNKTLGIVCQGYGIRCTEYMMCGVEHRCQARFYCDAPLSQLLTASSFHPSQNVPAVWLGQWYTSFGTVKSNYTLLLHLFPPRLVRHSKSDQSRTTISRHSSNALTFTLWSSACVVGMAHYAFVWDNRNE